MSNIMHICCACKRARGTHEYHDETLGASHWYCDRCNEGWMTEATENAEVIMTFTSTKAPSHATPRLRRLVKQYEAWRLHPAPK